MLHRASPEVAAYPFTTLMPNLGVMTSEAAVPSTDGQWAESPPILADLPGLIDGAHKVCTSLAMDNMSALCTGSSALADDAWA